MLCVEDYIDALSWAKKIGGLDGLMTRANANASEIGKWVERTDWVDFLAEDPATRSNTSVCLKIVDVGVSALDLEAQWAFVKRMTALLEEQEVAFDIGAYPRRPARTSYLVRSNSGKFLTCRL